MASCDGLFYWVLWWVVDDGGCCCGCGDGFVLGFCFTIGCGCHGAGGERDRQPITINYIR